jgi:hypothetical protein
MEIFQKFWDKFLSEKNSAEMEFRRIVSWRMAEPNRLPLRSVGRLTAVIVNIGLISFHFTLNFYLHTLQYVRCVNLVWWHVFFACILQ